MRELIQAIQAELRAEISYIRDGDIYIAADTGYLPDHVLQPCLGIKDGEATRVELAGGMWEVTLTVELIIFVQLHKEEAGVVGDSASGRKGVLEIAADIHAALDENLLGITGMISAFSPSESESRLFVDEDGGGLQQKIITYQYVKEEDRP